MRRRLAEHGERLRWLTGRAALVSPAARLALSHNDWMNWSNAGPRVAAPAADSGNVCAGWRDERRL